MAKRITLSDSARTNSHGYKIDLNGMETERFSANPVMLFEHDGRQVIGRWENYSIADGKLTADPVFDIDDPVGAEVARKYENDFLRAASVGIVIKDMQQLNGEWVVTRCELVEASIVSIPADSGAVVLYDENREKLTFEQAKLNFTNNNQQGKKMETLTLTQATVTSLGLSGAPTPREVELAVAEKDREIEKLNLQVKTMQNAQVKDYLTNAVKVGKISETERVEFEKLALNGGFDAVKTIINGKEEAASATLASQVANSSLTAGRENWDYMKWMKEDSAGLQKLKLENPTQFERLQETLKK